MIEAQDYQRVPTGIFNLKLWNKCQSFGAGIFYDTEMIPVIQHQNLTVLLNNYYESSISVHHCNVEYSTPEVIIFW